MCQKFVKLLILGWLMALTREEDLGSPQDGAADCEEDISPWLCDFPDISKACKKNPEMKQNCPFSCSLSGQLWRAAWSGNLDGVTAALTTGANPLCHNSITHNDTLYVNRTAIHMAALANHPEVVKALLDAGVDVNIQLTGWRTNGITPTYDASSNGSIDSLNVLIEHNANVNIAGDYWEYTPLIQAAWHDHLKVAEALINANASIGVGDRSGNTAHYYAVFYGNHDIISLLTGKNANVNIGDSDTNFLLLQAAWHGHLNVAKALINANASLDAIDIQGKTALHFAAEKNNKDIAMLLIESGASLDVRDKGGNTALHLAAVYNNQDMAVLLIESGTSLDVRDIRGDTALHRAARYNNQDIAILLIESGANTRVKNTEGDNPSDEARLAGHNQLAELIESYCNGC